MNQFKLNLVLLALLFCFGCSSGNDSQSESFDEIEDVSEEAAEQEPVPILVMTYSVASFEDWTTSYAADKDERESFNLSDLGFLASADDPRKISVILRTADHQKSEEYANSEELRESLSEMGVIGEPEVRYMNAIKLPERPVTQRYRMMITHQVEDFDRWKEIFDLHEAERLDAGLELIGIARDSSEENLVSVLFAFEDMDAAKIFASSDELKNAMKESGVISDPVLTWLEKPSLD